MSPRPNQKSQMHTESPHIRPSLTGNPKNPQIPLLIVLNQLGVINRPYPKLPLHSRNQRRPLKQRPRQRLHRTVQLPRILHGGM